MLRKVYAFTVIEMAVASMLASIVIGIIYTSYVIFNSQYNKNMQKGESISEFLLLQKALQADFDSATWITGTTDTKISHGFADGSTANYFFDSEAVVREMHFHLDTFKVSLVDARANYLDDRVNTVKQLSLRFQVNEEALSALFIKSYTAKELIRTK